LSFQGGFIALYRQHFNALTRRAPGIQLPIAIYIIGQTDSAARRPEYARIPIKDFMMLTGAKERMNWEALAKLEDSGLLKRDGQGGYKVCLDAIDDVPLPSARTCKRRAKIAANHAPSSIAALHLNAVNEGAINENQITREAGAGAGASQSGAFGYRAACDGPGSRSDEGADKAVAVSDSEGSVAGNAECGDGRLTSDNGSSRRQADDGGGAEMVHSVSDVGLHLDAVTGAINFQKPATYCPWNWACPHLSTASPLVSIEAKKHIEPTTTGAAIGPAETQERARCLTPSPDENPYLARFLQPESGDEQRIGDALTRSGVPCDLMAARRMWAECRAVNPALTVREFLVLVALKLNEWSRHSDDLPGRRTTTVIGSLIKSMPNAVCGAVYRAARERAAAELARDVRDAEAILQGDSTAGDREWALGILAERDGSLS